MDGDETSVVASDVSSELPTSMSKRQLKKVKKREKWLERKGEKRLGIPNVARACSVARNLVNFFCPFSPRCTSSREAYGE